ncbi:MAG: uroporphyrinogen decarboxylase (URO-D) [Oscillospiraceae bacterium]|nr:uroporphyrinogen decarboxylase (URO-D) [Oscillospiraceae bacterium]
MLSPRDNLLETLKIDGKPDRLVNMWEPFELVPDPCMMFDMGGPRERGKDSRDAWGTLIIWPEDSPGGMPHVTDTEKVCPEITEWRDYVKVPDIAAGVKDNPMWEMCRKERDRIHAEGKLYMNIAPTGVYERLHFLMGFEDMLVNYLLEPEAMQELCEVIGDYRAEYFRLLCENCKPDIVLSHDDWGSKHALFVSPETWREFIKPQYEKCYKVLKDNGVIIMHHSDSFCEPIIRDMVDVGIDIWQGAIPENDIVRLSAEAKGEITMMGGCDMSILDLADSTEEVIRKETRRCCEDYGKLGHFIPSFTYGGPGDVIYKHVDPIMYDEIAKYNQETYGISTNPRK